MIRAVGRRRREESIVAAFDHVRLLADAENGQPRTLAAYLDDLKSDAERLEDSAAALARMFDAKIARDKRRAANDEGND